MKVISDYAIPVIITGILLGGLYANIPVFDAFLKGATDSIAVIFRILPSLVALTTAIGIFRASGALDLLCHSLAPAAKALALPMETMALAILRPISGSGAMVVFKDLLANFGPDSYVGRVASVMMGSTETTFYTIAIYFGATAITKTRHTLVASLSADLVGFVMSALAVRLMLGV